MIGTVSVLSTPQQFEPVNTDGLWFQLYSASYSTTNFTYITDVYSWNLNPTDTSGTQSLGRFKIPPRPSTGFGVFTPHKILKSQISNKWVSGINLVGVSLTYGTMVKYWIDYGFQYTPDIPITRTIRGTSSYVQMYYTGTYSDIKLGDTLGIIMTNQKVNPDYNTSDATVVAVSSSATPSFTVDIPFGVTQSNESGVVYQLTRIVNSTNQTNSGLTQGQYTWGSIRQYGQKGQDFTDLYVLDDNNQSFLTTYTYSTGVPTYIKTTYADQYDVASFILNGNKQSVSKVGLSGYDQYNNLVTTATYSLSSTIDYKGKFDIGIGVANLRTIFPSTDFDTLSSYKIYLYGNMIGYSLSATAWSLHIVAGYTSSYSVWDPYGTYGSHSVVVYNDLVYFNTGTGNNNRYLTPEFDTTNWSFDGGPVYAWSPTSTYTFNDYVLFDGKIYENQTAINGYTTYSYTGAVGNIARKIDTTCSVYDNTQLRFLNRAGGYDCWNFIRNSKKTLNVQRTEWRQELPWNYTIGDRQQSVLSQKAEMSYMINTDWLTEYDYEFLQELITSPEVYRVEGTYSYPIVITDTSWVQKTRNTEVVFNLTLNYKDAYNIMTQDS